MTLRRGLSPTSTVLFPRQPGVDWRRPSGSALPATPCLVNSPAWHSSDPPVPSNWHLQRPLRGQGVRLESP